MYPVPLSPTRDQFNIAQTANSGAQFEQFTALINRPLYKNAEIKSQGVKPPRTEKDEDKIGDQPI